MTTAEHWLLDIISQTQRLTETADRQLNDVNEARWLVHGVMLDAMKDRLGPASRSELDGALGRALRHYPANAA